ncbi:sugar transferase [Patescibacteria group bacterium]|nr:sugar transferase [Patescibacteria group bacterium]MBU1922415.1 sugar transferase [Patescibacteria group bacterium]
MKRVELFFSAILVPLDFFMLLAAAVLTYFLRFESVVQEFRPVIYEIPFNEYFATSAIIGLVWLVFFALAGLYQIRRRRVTNELVRIFLACSTGILAVIVLIFFQRELFSSRFVVLGVWVLSIIFVAVARLIVRSLQHSLYRARIGLKRVVIIGSDKTTDDIMQVLKSNPVLGYRVVKNFVDFSPEVRQAILKCHQKERIDEIILTDPKASKDLALGILNFANENNITFKYSADLFATQATNIGFDTLAGVPIVEMKRTKLEGWGKIFKRGFDIIASLILLILTLPITLLAALAVRVESRGPIFFKNERVGQLGEKFFTFKIRSMRPEVSIGPQFANQKKALELEQRLIKEKGIKQGPVYKIADDPRVTRVGRFIRKYSLDELPQFVNVLRGDMSLVGPRPHQPREVENYKKEHRQILLIRPGITGLAQISGRSDLEFDDEAKLDIYYIEQWSPWLDLWILLKTPFVVLQRRGVY